MKTKYMYKACNICKNEEPLIYIKDEFYNVKVVIRQNKMCLIINDEIVNKIDINYCPTCKETIYTTPTKNKGQKETYKSGCNYCNGIFHLLIYYIANMETLYNVLIYGNKIRLFINGDEKVTRTINRCPICRKKLK